MRRSLLTRLCLFLALLLSLSFSSLGPPGPASARAPVAMLSYQLNFLPSTVKRLCLGDSAVFRFAVRMDDIGPLAPLVPAQVTVVTSNGSANPVLFEMRGTSGVFQFEYTAETPGEETITVQVVDGTGSAAKSFKIFEACDYEVTFFASQQEEQDVGGFNVAFWGAGDLGLARRSEDGLALAGDGNDAASLLLYAYKAGLFYCGMAPYSGESTFTMDGALWPDQDLIHFNLEFQPITFPDHMVFSCSGVGMGASSIDVPIPANTGDVNELDLSGIVVDASGGTYQFAFGKSTGVMTVRKAAQ